MKPALSAKPAHPHFQATRWSLVLQAKGPPSPDSRRALNQLCQAYWYPVYAFVRRKGFGEQDAEDLTQDFFAKSLELSTIDKADRSRGRFRTFLLSCLENFLRNAYAKARAQKRDITKVVSFDALDAAQRYAAEPVDDLSPDRLFERAFALEVLRGAEAELEADRRYDGKLELFLALKPHLYAGENDQTVAALAAQLSMELETVKSHIHRMRTRFRDILRARAAEIVTHPEDAKDELLALQKAL